MADWVAAEFETARTRGLDVESVSIQAFMQPA